MFHLVSERNSSQLKRHSSYVQLYFDERGTLAFSLILPTEEEIQSHKITEIPTLSVNELVRSDKFGWENRLRRDVDLAVEKLERFGDSQVYLSKVAGLASSAGAHEISEKLYEKAIALDRSNVSVRHRYSSELIRNSDFELAEKYLNENNPFVDPFSILQLAFISIKRDDYDSAFELVEKSLEIDPSNFDARLFAGTLCIYFKKWQQSIRHFKVASEENGRSSPLFVNMAYSYWMLGEIERAESCVKKSLLINPLNRNAVVFYANIAHEQKKDCEAIPFIEFFLEYEQKDIDVWEQLGLAYYYEGSRSKNNSLYFKSLDAFKIQNTLKSSVNVWNNIALDYWKLGETAKAQKYFSQAIYKAGEDDDVKAAVLPIYNYTLLLLEGRAYKDAKGFLDKFLHLSILGEGDKNLFERLKLLYLNALDNGNLVSNKELVILSQQFLEEGIESEEVKFDIANRLLIFFAGEGKSQSAVHSIVERFNVLIENKDLISEQLRSRIINNIVFSYCIFDEILMAQSLIGHLNKDFYKDPYATATLGLLNLKKGKIESGKSLYKVAIDLLGNRQADKRRFELRYQFELGNSLFKMGDVKKAAKFFLKASKNKSEDRYLVSEARIKLTECNRLLSN